MTNTPYACAQNSSPSLVCEKFSRTSGTSVLFSRKNSFHLCCLGNLSTIKFAICILKARLGGEICLCDVIMHKGYRLWPCSPYLSNTLTNLCIALYFILLYCVALNCIVLFIYCYVDIIQYNAMHKFVGVLDNPL